MKRGKGNGYAVTKKGHLRFYSPPALRGKYVHRVIMSALLEATHPLTRATLHEANPVHHQDGRKTHNCPENLMLLDPVIHSVLTNVDQVRCPFTGKYIAARELMKRLGYSPFAVSTGA